MPLIKISMKLFEFFSGKEKLDALLDATCVRAELKDLSRKNESLQNNVDLLSNENQTLNSKFHHAHYLTQLMNFFIWQIFNIYIIHGIFLAL